MDKVQTIIDLTSEHFGIPVELIKMEHKVKGSKKRPIAMARQSAMVLISENANLSFKEIGEQIGKRDRTCVYHAKDTIKDLMDTDKEFNKTFCELVKKVYMAFNPLSPIEKRFLEFGYVFIGHSPRKKNG